MARTRRFGIGGPTSVKRFGWNSTDTTSIIQAAIDTGAAAIEVPWSRGHDGEWLVTPLTAASDQIIVNKGVIRAKSSGYGATASNLIAASLKDNFGVHGPGTLQMRREELSVTSEGPHCYNARGSTNGEFVDTTFKYGSGDGLYFGPDTTGDRTGCSNMNVRDCVFTDNRRQGMSIVAGSNILIERCKFSSNGFDSDGSAGAQPRAGLDIEPETEEDSVNNITIRHCTFSNNGITGAIVNVNELESSSQPCNILFDQCVFEGGAFGLRLRSLHPSGASIGPTGTVEIRDSIIRSTGWQGIWIDDWDPGRAHKLKFTRCRLVNVAQTQAGTVPIFLEITDECIPQSTGGIVFDECVIIDNMNRNPIEVAYTVGDQLDDSTARVTGTIRVVNPYLSLGAFSSGMANLSVTVVASA